MRCRHLWQITERVEQPSGWEVATAGLTRNFKADSLPYDFWTRPVIVTYRCARCRSEKVERV